ncbi:hypothetical protein ACHAXR_002005, partial [Thalassiosira sp. AJA248-18]
AMSIYGVGLMPLASHMRDEIPDALQPWFADDAAGAGKAIHNPRCLNFLMEHGPSGFTFYLQNEWQYVQRVVADTAPFFAPLETAIRNEFIPALVGMPSWDMDGKFHALLANGVKNGGLAIPNPVDTAEYVHKALMEATGHLTTSLVDAYQWNLIFEPTKKSWARQLHELATCTRDGS